MRLILEAKYEDDLLCRQCFAETAKKKKMEIHLPEAYLQPSRTFTMELFCENSERLKADNYFRKIAPS